MTRSPSRESTMTAAGPMTHPDPIDRCSGELRMRQDHGVGANLNVLVDGDRLGQPHCDTLAHEALPLSLPGPRFGAREVGAVIDAEGVIGFARHRGDRPRLIVLSLGNGDRDQVRQIELARGAAGVRSRSSARRAQSSVKRHQPGVDLGRTDAHSGVIVASLGDPHRSLGRHRARCGRSRRDPERWRSVSPPWRRMRAAPARSLATVEGSRRG